MKFIDTNLLVRLITNDDAAQREQAAAWIEACGTGEILIPDIVLTELFFVLARDAPYNMSRQDICASLDDLLGAAVQLTVSDKARPALEIAAGKPGLDFTDCLLAVYADHRAKRVLSFDKDMLKILR